MRRVRFPKPIKRGSWVVTIYKTPTNGYVSFTVVHYDAKGARCRRSLADYTLARAAHPFRGSDYSPFGRSNCA